MQIPSYEPFHCIAMIIIFKSFSIHRYITKIKINNTTLLKTVKLIAEENFIMVDVLKKLDKIILVV